MDGRVDGEQSPRGPQPWHRAPDESAKAYQAFLAYLEAGPDRSLRRTARTLSKSLSLLKRWSARYQWQMRARAHDATQQEVAQEDARRVREDAYRRRTEHAAQLERIAMAGLRTLLVRDVESGELRFDSRLKPTDVAALIRAACQLLPAAEPEPQAGPDHQADLDHLSTRELRQLLSLLPSDSEPKGDDTHDQS